MAPGSRRPPHGKLKGKEIGMFYRNQQMKKNKQHENASRAHVLMSHNQKSNIEKTLSDVKTIRDNAISSSRLTELKNAHSVKTCDVLKLPFSQRLDGNHDLNQKFMMELNNKFRDANYERMTSSREKLPAFQKRTEIVKTIEENQVSVISGETGCGKTTQVPQLVLDYYISKGKGSACRVICTQPRRISAISIAQRVADERCEKLGNSTGYSIRVEHCHPRDSGSIVYCTTGMLLRWIHNDPTLSKASHVMLDEVHERSAHSDILLVLLKRLVQSGKRPDLRIVLMSATLNAEEIVTYFGNCISLHIPGFTFPVTEFYLEDVLQLTDFEPTTCRKMPRFRGNLAERRHTQQQQMIQRSIDESVEKLGSKYNEKTRASLLSMDHEAFDEYIIHNLVRFICSTQPPGAILIFVPGWEQIRKVSELLTNDFYFHNDLIIPLHSLMPTAEQKSIFNRPPFGVRKIIVATSIAETSITIDDVVYVIDCGKTKEANFDVERCVKTLQPEWVSVASAKQRRGRAGRVQKGYCFHLYARAREHFLLSYQIPELQRMSLESVILELIELEVGDIFKFFKECMSMPSEECINHAIRELKQMNAITSDMKLTPLGYHLAMLPVEPRIGKFILYGSIFSCLDPVLTIAACFSHKDPFVVPIDKEFEVKKAKKSFSMELSDPLVYANAVFQYERLLSSSSFSKIDQFCWNNFLSKSTLKFILEMKKQFAEYLRKEGFIMDDNYKDTKYNKFSQSDLIVKAMVVAGFYPSIIKVTTRPDRGRSKFQPLFSSYGSVDIHLKSVAADIGRIEYQYLVNYMRVRGLSSVNLFDVSPAHPYALMLFGSDVRKGVADNGDNLIIIDGEISFKCDSKLADTIIDLSQELSNLLEAKIVTKSLNDPQLQHLQSILTKAVVDLLMSDQTR